MLGLLCFSLNILRPQVFLEHLPYKRPRDDRHRGFKRKEAASRAWITELRCGVDTHCPSSGSNNNPDFPWGGHVSPLADHIVWVVKRPSPGCRGGHVTRVWPVKVSHALG